MDIFGLDLPATYFTSHPGDSGIAAARTSFRAWRTITEIEVWNMPQDIQKAHPKASILKYSRVVFNIKGNDFRLVCKVNYKDYIVEIRWFGTHAEYDKIDAETI